MEQYLIDEYSVVEDENWLTDESQIEEYFRDSGSEYLDCGQGYYQDEAEVICKIGDKFYEVKLEAEILGAKQDIGDKLYWVENIRLVTYQEIEKPQPKEKSIYEYRLALTKEQAYKLEKYLKDNKIKVIKI